MLTRACASGAAATSVYTWSDADELNVGPLKRSAQPMSHVQRRLSYDDDVRPTIESILGELW